jgi:hypothetical protein
MLKNGIRHVSFAIEQAVGAGNSPDLQSGGARSESRPGHRMTEIFVIFLTLAKQILGKYLKLGHNRFFPHAFLFIIHYLTL